MTVREYIETTTKTYIKLGSKDSNSGFIYCGPVCNLVEYITEFDKEEPKRLADILEKRTSELITISDESNIQLYMRKGLKQYQLTNSYNNIRFKSNSMLQDYMKTKRQKRIKKLTEYTKFLKDYIANYTSILDREVLEVYPSTVVNIHGCISDIVIFDGIENLGYWDEEEFENGINEDNVEE